MLWLFAKIRNDAFFFLNCFTRRDGGTGWVVGQSPPHPSLILAELEATLEFRKDVGAEINVALEHFVKTINVAQYPHMLA